MSAPWLGSAPACWQAASASTVTHLICFDIDGTMLSTKGPGANLHQHTSFRVALKEVWGVDAGLEDLEHAGMTDQMILRELHALTQCKLPLDDAIRLAASRMVSYCAEKGDPGAGLTVLPGVVEVLRRLNASGCAVCGLVTGNLQPIAWGKLRALGLGLEAGQFVCGGFGSDAEDRAELIRVAIARARACLPGLRDDLQVFHVGDTPRDLQAAKNAGVRCLGVATGKFSVAELHEASQQCGGANTQVILEGLSDVDRVMEYFGLGEGRGSKSET